MAEIWSVFWFCGVVFESLVVDAVVFLGFVVNLWGRRSPILGFVDAIVFWFVVNLYGSSWVFMHLLVFFFFFSGGGSWDGYGFFGLRWKSVSLLDR